eukprot:1743902-Amphidinium_carterae.1
MDDLQLARYTALQRPIKWKRIEKQSVPQSTRLLDCNFTYYYNTEVMNQVWRPHVQVCEGFFCPES